MPQPQLTALDHLVLTVADIPRSIEFYTGALGMRAESFDVVDGSSRCALRFGPSKINLHEAGREFEPKAARPSTGSADLCFLTDRPLADWIGHLKARNIAVEEGPVARTGARFPLTSIYLRDPDGNLIEIATESAP
ncbi:VOC family protein [Marimonas sp. MJW-29]|uniref:VOC family protein n=1 Tax=Sulfitobacter sediminis TaxID=3234186 RepID=A0ABV3RH01_9RHOB